MKRKPLEQPLLSELLQRTVDSAVSTVRSSSDFGGSVDLDVVDDEGISIEHLDLSIAFSVLEQLEKYLGALLRPATLRPCCVMVLGLERKKTPHPRRKKLS